MKAYVLHGINDLRLDDVSMPEISENEVLVEVKAAGICGSDIPRIYKTGAYHHPLIPGHEFSGKVVKTTRKNSEWLNKRVSIFPLIPCKNCISCRNKQYEMCSNYSYLGSRRDGGFAEYVNVPADNLIELPGNVSFEEAAMLEPMSVAVHAIRRILPGVTDTAVICGLGTIGLFIAMFLKEMGNENILVIGNKDFQKNKITALGIPENNFCDSRTENTLEWIENKTAGRGADIFFECVGKNETVSTAIENTAPAGKITLVGNPYSDMLFEKSVYWQILRRQLTVTGTWNSSFLHEDFDDWHYVLNKLSDKKIDPSGFITHRFDMENFIKGFEIMQDKSEDYVKIIMKL